jgi:signal transduction histidine kinase
LPAVAVAATWFARRGLLSRCAIAEQHLDLAQDGTGVGVYQLNFSTNTAFASPSLCRLLGQPIMSQSLRLDEWFAALSVRHVEDAERMIREQIARGELRYTAEQEIERPDGVVRWFRNRVQLELSPAGALVAARGATVDITERRLLLKVQSELKQQVADLRRLNLLSNELAAASDDLTAPLQSLLRFVLESHGADQGFVTLCDGSQGRFTVVAAQGLPSGCLLALVHSVDDTATMVSSLSAHDEYARHIGCGEVRSIPIRTADGRVAGVIAVMLETARATHERETELGQLCAAMAGALVERVRARTLAAQEGRRFAVAIESSTVPFNILAAVRDHAGSIVDLRWTYVNEAAAKLLGRSTAEVVNRNVSEILPRNWETPGLLARFASVIDQGVTCEFETRSAHRPEVWLNVTATNLLGAVAVWYADISQRKREELERHLADQRKDEFLATLAHELRNPLAPIRQSVRIACAAGATVDQVRRSHEVIERQVQHMALLLDDLLDVSRITRGSLILRRSLVKLSSIMEAAIEVARPLFDTQAHHFTLELPDHDVWVEVDPLRIAQVIGNLLTNAAKYTDPRGRILCQAVDEGDHVMIRVRDNGIGFTESQAAEMFDMFSQAPAALGRSRGGLGIGLALSRSLARLHGGDIMALSMGPGEGSEFIVRLPRGTRHADDAGDLSVERTAVAGLPRRILIADDNVDAADSLAGLLELEGHEVHVAYDGQQALEQFCKHTPDAAFLDVGMPKMSGYEVARAIRGLPTGQRIVMVAITGWGQIRDRHAALEAGFDHHTTKPVDPIKILSLIGS